MLLQKITESKEIQNHLKVHKQLSSRVRGCIFPENITNIALVLVTQYFEQTILNSNLNSNRNF